jgi:hypothetical protein
MEMIHHVRSVVFPWKKKDAVRSDIINTGSPVVVRPAWTVRPPFSNSLALASPEAIRS